MSEHNYFGLAAKELIKNRPQDFIVTADTVKEVEAGAKKHRAVMAKLNPAKPTPARVEYEALRRKLYGLQQDEKNLEIRVTNEAGNVAHCLNLISDFLRAKKAAIADNRLGDERSYENRLVIAEGELQEARERLVKQQKYHAGAVRDLRNFDGHDRIAELQTELGI